ncbi:hypothetical protein SH2C18_39590 [Clostridium sediminicola]|uniref:hypothetical protein n=1 Tax=Clostridium sediminicola TaxID=3114879 RepID=UPI0031F2133E
MANKNVVIKTRNDSNSDWDIIYPVTIADNVKCSDGRSVCAQLKDIVNIIQNISILSANWIDDTATRGFWVYDYSDTKINSNTIVDINVHLSSLENASDLKSVTESFDGYVRLYASSQPQVDLNCDLKLIKQVGDA